MSAPPGKAGIARGTAWALLSQAAGMLVPLLLTPYIVSKVGLERYGLWVVVSAATAWLAHYDLGLGAAITRETARRRATEDLAGLARLWGGWLRQDLLCMLLLGVLAGAAASLLPGEPLLLCLLSLQALLVPLYRHHYAALSGIQRIESASRLDFLVLPLSAAGTVGVLEAGYGLVGMAANGLVWLLAQLAGLGVLLRRAGHPAPDLAGREDLAALRGFGFRAYGAQAVTQAFRSDRLFLWLAGVPAVSIASYQFGAGLAERLGNLVAGLSSALPAAISDLHERGDAERVRRALLRGSRLHAVAAFLLLGFTAAFAPVLLQFWLGSVPPGSAEVLRIASLGMLVAVIGAPLHATTVALGAPGRSGLAMAGGLGLALALYTTLGRRYDGTTLAASLAFGWAAAQVLLAAMVRRQVGFSWGELAGNALLKPSIILVPLGLVYVAWRFGMGGDPGSGRWEALRLLAPAFGGTALLAWPAARLTGAIERDDVGLLRSLGRRKTA